MPARKQGFTYIARYDRRVTCEFMSHTVTRVLGWQPEDLTGASMFELMHQDDQRMVEYAWLERLHLPVTTGSRTSRVRLRKMDGTYCWCDVQSTPIKLLADSRPTRLVVQAKPTKVWPWSVLVPWVKDIDRDPVQARLDPTKG